MISPRQTGLAALLALAALVPARTEAFEPTRFTFTPTFNDPDPGTRHWEKRGNGYVEKLPSGRTNAFRIQKQAFVAGLKGTILQKIEEPNFFVFVADSEASRKELWWWRDKGPWNFMGLMRDVSAPVRID